MSNKEVMWYMCGKIFDTFFSDDERSAGVLMHISSLPSKYGIGTFGKDAYEFVDFLRVSGQRYWQILPMCPVGEGNSPYKSFSAYAGNPYFIDLDLLCDEGLIEADLLNEFEFGEDETKVDYTLLECNRLQVLRLAYENFDRHNHKHFEKFCTDESFWLDDYAMFMALKKYFNDISWYEFPEDIRYREKNALLHYKNILQYNIGFFKFLQFEFSKQWFALKAYANKSGVQIIGDLPIYVALDSVDTWCNTKIFKLDENLQPKFVAGCPPDAFSKSGQLWGNPVYDWKYLESTNFKWWIQRIKYNQKMFDVIRIDHFRGFESYYEIPFVLHDAAKGEWVKGPSERFFLKVKEKLGNVNVIAEDLGFVTKDVKELLSKTGFAGMKILQFAFDMSGKSDILPHNLHRNSIVYTGTHDNETLMGWSKSTNVNILNFAKEYMHIRDNEKINWGLIRLAYTGVNAVSIVQMQDFLGLDNVARTNVPSTIGSNWSWRLKKGDLSYGLAKKIRQLIKLYGRLGDDSNMIENFIFEDLELVAQNEYCKNLKELTVPQLHYVLGKVVMGKLAKSWQESKERQKKVKKACYFSVEFLMGRLIYNNLFALGLLDYTKEILESNGLDINSFEEIEDVALGNGGLGRLAACFLDSAATHRLPLNGYGIRYKYGLFKQVIENGYQKEYADDWSYFGDPWSVRREEDCVEVSFVDQNVKAVPYDMPIIGFENENINTLRLWQCEPTNEFAFDKFNANEFDEALAERTNAECISDVLYPNDSARRGKVLRLKQQYFFTSASIQDILKKFMHIHGKSFEKLPDSYAIQLNDTHPVVAIPELIRLLMLEGLSFDDAFDIAQKIFSYTNHTIMTEALEKWDVDIIKSILPNIYDIIVKINERLVDELTLKGLDAPIVFDNVYLEMTKLDQMKIIYAGKVYMANLAVFASEFTNGVSQIHTDILKKDVLANWYSAYPSKFKNITNGITQRRWLGLANKELANLITEYIGDTWITELTELKKLSEFVVGDEFVNKFDKVKQIKKQQLSDYIYKCENVKIDPSWIYDVQVKRIHEYKRQLLNAISIMYLYFGIKDGSIKDFYPTVFIFGGKAAPGYGRAKGIIKYINEIARLVNSDPRVNKKMKIVFVSDYDCSYAEKIIAAADISEQISTAGTEASGTGNMKFMLNGAVTCGTYDGANVEIVQQAGEENEYIFGARVEDLEREKSSYDPYKIYDGDEKIKQAVDTLVDGILSAGKRDYFRNLYESLVSKYGDNDKYFLLYDLKSYIETKLQMNRDYVDRLQFRRKGLENLLNAGIFSSDRAVKQYAKEIWKVKEY